MLTVGVREWQTGWIPFGESGFEVPAADRNVGVIAADLDLLSAAFGTSFIIHTQHHRGFLSAMADSFDFVQNIGPGEQIQTAFKKVALEVCSQTICDDRNAEIVRDVTQFVNLLPGKKLSLIDKDGVHRIAVVFPTADLQQGVTLGECDCRSIQPDARCNAADAVPSIQLWSQEKWPHTTFLIIPGGLQ